jgi:hypothetical protein
MNLTIETEREDDGRLVAEVPELAAVLACGHTVGQSDPGPLGAPLIMPGTQVP